MKVTIRREEYEVYSPEHVRVDDRGVCPHLLLFSGQYWQRVPMKEDAAQKSAKIINDFLRLGLSCCDLNTLDIETKVPKFKTKGMDSQE